MTWDKVRQSIYELVDDQASDRQLEQVDHAVSLIEDVLNAQAKAFFAVPGTEGS